MEANILLNQNKYELKYINVRPGKLVSDTLKPGFTKYVDGRYWWSKKNAIEIEARWDAKEYFDGITVSTVENSDKFQVIEGKLYLRPYLQIVFDNQTIIERFDTEQQLNDRLVYLKDNIFVHPDVNFAKFNAESFEYQSQGYFM